MAQRARWHAHVLTHVRTHPKGLFAMSIDHLRHQDCYREAERICAKYRRMSRRHNAAIDRAYRRIAKVTV